MGSILHKIRLFIVIAFLSMTSLFSQETNIDIDAVVILGETPPFEFCQGEIPSFEIQMSLKAGSATLTLTSTSTLEFTAIGSGANNFTYTITNVSNLLGGNQINTGPNSNQYRWPTVGPNAIQLINGGVQDIIFKVSLNSAIYTDPDNPDAAVSSLTMNVNSNPPQVNINTSQGPFDGSRNITVCQSDTLTLIADPGYTHYQFQRRPNGLLGFIPQVKSTQNTITLTNINAGGEDILVTTFNGDCQQNSQIFRINVSSITTVNLNAPNDTACSGGNIEFFATGSGAWYEFLVNSGGVITSQQSSTSDTWSSTILNDRDEVIVRNYTTSATTCYGSDSVTAYINSFSNDNDIDGDQTICFGETPGQIISITESTADRNSDGSGAVINYYWESNNGSGWSGPLAGSNSSTFQPSALTTTTSFRRVLRSQFRGSDCTSISDTVTITVTPGPTISGFTKTSGDNPTTICDGDIPTFTVTSTGVTSPSFRFYHQGNPISNLITGSTTASHTVTSTINLNDLDEIRVEVYANPDGTGCSVSQTFTLRVNEFDATLNEIGGNQIVCNDDAITEISDISSPTAPGLITIKWYSSPSGLATPLWSPVAGNNPNFTPLSITGDTDFQRVLESNLGGKICYSYSNIVTKEDVEINADLVSNDLSSNPINDLICEGETILFDAGASTGASGYQFSYNGAPIGAFSSNTTITFNGFSDGEKFSVTVSENADGSGCTSTATVTIRVNSFTGSHTLTDSQTICLGDNAIQINPTNTPTPTIISAVATYQWQRRDFGSLTWYNIPGAAAQLPSYTPPAGAVTQTTFYKRLLLSLNPQLHVALKQHCMSHQSILSMWVFTQVEISLHPQLQFVQETLSTLMPQDQ